MMTDLRVQVMKLLDDPTLEAVKLTQYVVVLRLMQAAKPQVVDKLLIAHRQRSQRMIRWGGMGLAKINIVLHIFIYSSQY
jgi:hypothetical protein